MEQKLLDNLVDSSANVYPNSTIMQRVIVTQAILESGFLGKKGGSDLALKYNNLFGIKASQEQIDDGKSVRMPTTEYNQYGDPEHVMADFAVYDDHEQAFAAHKTLMDHDRYKPVRDAEGVYDAFTQLQRCGYATDPNYPRSLRNIYDNFVEPVFKQRAEKANEE